MNIQKRKKEERTVYSKYSKLVNCKVPEGGVLIEAEQVFGDEVNISTKGKRHLGAVIGSENYKDQYCGEKISKWKEKLLQLSEIKNKTHNRLTLLLQGVTS